MESATFTREQWDILKGPRNVVTEVKVGQRWRSQRTGREFVIEALIDASTGRQRWVSAHVRYEHSGGNRRRWQIEASRLYPHGTAGYELVSE